MDPKEASRLTHRLLWDQRAWRTRKRTLIGLTASLQGDGIQVERTRGAIALIRPLSGIEGVRVEFRSTGVVMAEAVRKQEGRWFPHAILVGSSSEGLAMVLTGTA